LYTLYTYLFISFTNRKGDHIFSEDESDAEEDEEEEEEDDDVVQSNGHLGNF